MPPEPAVRDLVPAPGAWLVLALVASGAFLLVAEGVAEARDGEELEGLARLDDAVEDALRPRVGEGLARAGVLLDGLGGGLVTALAVLGAALVLAWRGAWREAGALVAAAVTLQVLVASLKLAFARPRPPDALVFESTYAFPSGHAAYAALLSVLLAWLALRHARRRGLVALLLAVAVAWSVAVSASRLVVGAHYLSDVVAGAALGVAVGAGALGAPALARWKATAERRLRRA